MKNRIKVYRQHDELYSVCRNIAKCAHLVRVCDAILKDHNGRSKNPGYVEQAEIRIVLNLPEKAPTNGYKGYVKGNRIYVRRTNEPKDEKRDPNMSIDDVLRIRRQQEIEKKENNGSDLSSLRAQYGLGGNTSKSSGSNSIDSILRSSGVGSASSSFKSSNSSPSNLNSDVVNKVNNSNLVKVFENLATIAKLITATTATLGMIKAGSSEIINTAKQASNILSNFSFRLGTAIRNLKRAKK